MIIHTKSGIPYGAIPKHSKKPIINKAEAEFAHDAMKAGYQVYKSGWPDFLIKNGSKVFAVKVKLKGQVQTPIQLDVMGILSDMGIKCLVWKPESGFSKFNKNPPPKNKRLRRRLGPILQWADKVN